VLAFASLAPDPKPRKPKEANVNVSTNSFFISTLHFETFHRASCNLKASLREGSACESFARKLNRGDQGFKRSDKVDITIWWQQYNCVAAEFSGLPHTEYCANETSRRKGQEQAQEQG
jgi:hypothetical protein